MTTEQYELESLLQQQANQFFMRGGGKNVPLRPTSSPTSSSPTIAPGTMDIWSVKAPVPRPKCAGRFIGSRQRHGR